MRLLDARIVLLMFCLSAGPAAALTLVTADEAALPVPKTLPLLPPAASRGITRGPEIEVESPRNPAKPVHSPFPLRIGFVAHGGAHINPTSVRVFYLREGNIDLTSRLKSEISATGINVPDAETPPGEHAFRIEVQDDDGRTTSTDVVIKVSSGG